MNDLADRQVAAAVQRFREGTCEQARKALEDAVVLSLERGENLFTLRAGTHTAVFTLQEFVVVSSIVKYLESANVPLVDPDPRLDAEFTRLSDEITRDYLALANAPGPPVGTHADGGSGDS